MGTSEDSAHQIQNVSDCLPAFILPAARRAGIGRADFHGGWGREGGEILLPLSPEHMLYTKVGSKPRRDTASPEMAQLIQRLTIEHTHRFIFVVEPDHAVENLRPRLVDPTAFQKEADFWKRWQVEQGEIERSLLGGTPLTALQK